MTNARIDSNTLSQCKQLEQLNPIAMDQLAQSGVSRSVKQGEFVWLDGDEVNKIYVLLDGCINFIASDDQGSKPLIHPIVPHQLFGEVELFLDLSTYQNSAQCQTDCEIFCIDMALFSNIVFDDKDYMRWWLKHFAERFQHTKKMWAALTSSTPKQQVTQFLNELYLIYGNGCRYELPITQENLASMIGVSRRVMNDCLKELATEKRITLSYGKISIDSLIPE